MPTVTIVRRFAEWFLFSAGNVNAITNAGIDKSFFQKCKGQWMVNINTFNLAVDDSLHIQILSVY